MPNEFTPYALVADDDGLIRIDAADILEAAGFRVHGARSCHEALANFRQAGGSIQLSLTDVQMPPGEMNGFYLAQECAKHWPDINILVASGMIQPKEGDLPKGAVFVRKPFSADVVDDRLQELLRDGAKPETLKRRLT